MATWDRIDGGVISADAVNRMVIVDANTIVALLVSGNIARSTDAGATWEIVATPLTGGFGLGIASNGAGILIANGDNGTTGLLIQSGDAGATWTDVTPGGVSPNGGAVQYFPGLGRFVAVDNSSDPTQVASSPDGATWDVAALSSRIITGSFESVTYANGKLLLVGVNVATGYCEIYTSADAITWTYAFNQGSGSPSGAFNSIQWNGTVWNAIGFDNGSIHTINYTSPDAAVWTARNSVAVPGPPLVPEQLVLGTDFLTGGLSGSTALVSRSSDNGVTFDAAVTVPGIAFVDTLLLDSSSGIIYMGGLNGIASSSDAIAWTTELTLPGSGEVDCIAFGSGLVLAGGIDNSGNAGIWIRQVPTASEKATGFAAAATSTGTADGAFGSVLPITLDGQTIGSLYWRGPVVGGTDTPPDLTLNEVDFTHYELDWTAATFASGESVSQYEIWRMVGSPNVGAFPDWTELQASGAVLTTVGAGTLTYTDATVDGFLSQYAYGIRVVGSLGGEILSNIILSHAIS